MTFKRTTKTTTAEQIRLCADLGMSRRQAAEQLGVGRDALRITASTLGIVFHGHSGCVSNSVELPRQAAHDPFGVLQ